MVMSVGDGNGKIDAPYDPFIGSGTTESLAVEYVGARGDLDADDLGAKRCYAADQRNQ